MNGSSLLAPTIERQVSELNILSYPVSVEEGYARWAATYDQTPNPLLALELRCLPPLLPKVAGKHVIDLACGTGRWLEKLVAAKPATAIGIDLSADMLAIAHQKPAITGRLVKADCLQLPLASNVFDLAICSFAVEHIVNLSEVAPRWSRVLKENADLFITGLHPTAISDGWRVGFRDGRGSAQIDSTPHSIKEMATAFRGAGFQLLHTQECCLGEPERPLFALAGKERSFDAARKIPAIVILHFRRHSRRKF